MGSNIRKLSREDSRLGLKKVLDIGDRNFIWGSSALGPRESEREAWSGYGDYWQEPSEKQMTGERSGWRIECPIKEALSGPRFSRRACPVLCCAYVVLWQPGG